MGETAQNTLFCAVVFQNFAKIGDYASEGDSNGLDYGLK